MSSSSNTIVFVIEKSDLELDTRAPQKSKQRKPNRSDITHQILLAIIDSPLRRQKNIEIFIQTPNHLLKIESSTRIPRSLHRFNGLIHQLNQKLKIKDDDGKVMLRLLKKPVERYLSPDSYRIGLSDGGVGISSLGLQELEREMVVFYVNAISKGSDENICGYDVSVKVSEYALSASVAVNRVCSFLEGYFGIF